MVARTYVHYSETWIKRPCLGPPKNGRDGLFITAVGMAWPGQEVELGRVWPGGVVS